MNLSQTNTAPADLVLRVNEVYHDVEEREYQDLHPEIFQREARRWREFAARSLAGMARPLRLLDIGSGTGFVGMQVAHQLRRDDEVICADLSANMLQVCRGNIEAMNLACRRRYLKLDGQRLPVEDGECDVVTMNSVLHHVPRIEAFLAEVARVLRPGGLVAIGHEPNRPFYEHPILWPSHQLMSLLFAPRQIVGQMLRHLGALDLVRRRAAGRWRDLATHQRTLAEVNRRLLADGSIAAPLTMDQLTELVDSHSPTAGGLHAGRGIDADHIRSLLRGFTIDRLETYNHLGDPATGRNSLTRRYAACLQRRFPTAGATLFIVLRAPGGA